MDHRVHFSSKSDLYATPWLLFWTLDARFHFDIDVCALPENAKCKRFYTPDDDGLRQTWKGTCWLNPPYGRKGKICRWIEKAYSSALSGQATTIALIPARTDTVWFQRYVMAATELWFVAGRIRFGGAKSGAPFPSAIAVFRKGQVGKIPALKGFSQN